MTLKYFSRFFQYSNISSIDICFQQLHPINGFSDYSLLAVHRENKMKKFLSIATLMAILFSPSLFAIANTGSSDVGLILSATIQGESKIKITDGTHSSLTSSEFDAATTSTQHTLVGSGKTGAIAYVHVKTNKHSDFSITMTATPLTSVNNSVKIDYTVYLDEGKNDVTFTTNAASNTNNVLIDGHGNGNAYGIVNGNGNAWAWGNAQKIFSYPVAVDLDDASYEAALEDTYSGTVSFNYATT